MMCIEIYLHRKSIFSHDWPYLHFFLPRILKPEAYSTQDLALEEKLHAMSVCSVKT